MEKLLLSCAVIWFTELVVSATLEILRFNRKIEWFRIQLIYLRLKFCRVPSKCQGYFHSTFLVETAFALLGCSNAAKRKGCSYQGTEMRLEMPAIIAFRCD